ncbi:MAG: efflux RND transporter periplasmic adaptor subunit [Chloroflexota bacterium]|nr:efflux RND transporter periplasmic adaptor subunit [Chloroflexota bacterium]
MSKKIIIQSPCHRPRFACRANHLPHPHSSFLPHPSPFPHPSPLPKGEGTASSPFGGGLRWGSKRLSKKLFITLMLGLFLLTACSSLPGQAEATPTPTPLIDDYTPVVSATGKIIPEEFATLSMKTSGIAAEILVSEDDVVNSGQILVRLEGTETLEAAISAARFEVVSAQQALDSLYDDPEVTLARKQQAIVEAQKEIDDAQRRLTNYALTAPQTDIDQAYANMILAQDKLEDAQEDFEEYENKPEDNLQRAAYLSKKAQAQDNYDDAVRHYNALSSNTGDELDVAEAEADLAMAQAQLEAAQRDYEILQQGPDPDDVEVAEARLENAQSQLDAAESALEYLELKAPFNGTIGDLYIHTGEWVTIGQPVLLLADLNRMQIETTDLNEIDVARITIGDSAIVTFDALPDVEIQGTVTRIAPKDAEGSGVNYPVILELDEIPAGLRWGMTTFVDIEVNE